MKILKILPVLSVMLTLPVTALATGASAGELLLVAGVMTRAAAYISAGIPYKPEQAVSHKADSNSYTPSVPVYETIEDFTADENAAVETSENTEITETCESTQTSESSESMKSEAEAIVISQNIVEYDDSIDRTSEGTHSGNIIRRHYGTSTTGEYITLKSGAQVRNLTDENDEALLNAALQLPELDIQLDSAEPQVLIVHTHTTESYEPYQRDYYDSSFPSRSRDPRYNMIAVGEVLAHSLAENGISVVHDGTLHDYPSYTGSYDRSEETIRAILEQYPSIKVVIDLHRDAMADSYRNRIAPHVEINGKSAAQFMLIAGCDDGRFNMPNYMENFKLAALIQNSAELMYPGLAKAVLFDYRNYNQHITTGSLLIEVGSYANSLDEALYTAELLGESMAAALSAVSASAG